MRENKIISIELTPVHVPFKDYVRKAMSESEGGLGMAIQADEKWLGGDFVICKLIDNDGNIGLGEAFVWLPETGVSPEQIIFSIQKSLFNYVLGENPFNVEKILFKMDNNVSRNEVAKGLLDMSCYDLMGKITGQPAYNFMGGKVAENIPLCALIPLAEPILMRGIAKSYFKRGFRTFRIKLGKSILNDAEIIESIRKALGPKINIRVDYNQAYTPQEAVKAIGAIEPYDIKVAEQPVNKEDYMGMLYVQKRVSIPLMSHEGCFSLRDIITLIELGAIEVAGINSERPGGVTNALKAIDYATMKGLSVVLHNQPLGIASAMQLHLAAARFNSLGHAIELFGHEMLEDDLIKKSIDYNNGIAKVPEGPGWGVKLDEEALKKYATNETIIINKK
ncbi:MAG: mandelate racemase/muconate lactonizing enzyme family protein [Promethearchaeota archaeon]